MEDNDDCEVRDKVENALSLLSVERILRTVMRINK
jgi:hypothetical protein